VQSIIQVGIQRVVYLEKKDHQIGLNAASAKMLTDARINVLALNELDVPAAVWCTDLSGFIAKPRT